MKLAFFIFLIFLAAATPDNNTISIVIKPENVAPKKPHRRDTAPSLGHVQMGIKFTEAPKRLSYDFQFQKNGIGVIVKNVDWMQHFKCDNRKFYARINEVDSDGNVIKTLFGSELNYSVINITIEFAGIYKIAIFPVGAYCEGIEYDFRYFSKEDITPITKFAHHLILCE